MKGQKSIFDEDLTSALRFAHEAYLNTVWCRNPFESKYFGAFWLLLEQEWAEQQKKFDCYPFDGLNDPYFFEDEDEWPEVEDPFCSEAS